MSELERRYYQQHFPQLERKYDSSVIFILAALLKLKPEGRIGFISSLTWQTGENFSKLRRTLFSNAGVLELINLPFDVFKDAYVDTGVYILGRKPAQSYLIYQFPKKSKVTILTGLPFVKVETSLISAPDYKVVLKPDAQRILLRCSQSSKFFVLGHFSDSTQGLAASFFKHSTKRKSSEWYPFANGAQVYRYEFAIGETDFAYMGDHKSLKHFYETGPKLLIRRLINRDDRLDATYFEEKMVFKKDVNPFVITDNSWNPLFVLGVINSRLISYLYINTSSIATKDDFRQTTLAELRRLPIPYANKSSCDKMASLVKQMLAAKKQLISSQIDKDKDFYTNRCDSLDRQIDALVYNLYDLTSDEIKAVEG